LFLQHKNTSDTKNRRAHTRLKSFVSKNGMKKYAQKNSDTEHRAFRYRCYAFYSVFGASFENGAAKTFHAA
jgi:hypothetical protein